LFDFFEIEKRFENEQIHAAGDQTFHLLAEDSNASPCSSARTARDARQWADAPANERLRAGGCVARHFGRRAIQLVAPDPAIRTATSLSDLHRSCSSRSRRARLHVLLVNLVTMSGAARLQLIVTLIDEHALCCTASYPSPIEDEDGRGREPFQRRCSSTLPFTAQRRSTSLRMMDDDARRDLLGDELEGGPSAACRALFSAGRI
jgi:hypothetical protein